MEPLTETPAGGCTPDATRVCVHGLVHAGRGSNCVLAWRALALGLEKDHPQQKPGPPLGVLGGLGGCCGHAGQCVRAHVRTLLLVMSFLVTLLDEGKCPWAGWSL